MAKVNKYGIKFDSELEVRYYELKMEQKVYFNYHFKHPIPMDFMDKGYKPDFLEFYYLDGKPIGVDDILPEKFVVKVIETKGYNQFSARLDGIIHNSMNNLVKADQIRLKLWLERNGVEIHRIERVEYQKIKYLMKHGWVDFKFKPSGLKDQWKKKCLATEDELKDAKKLIKRYKQYFLYIQKEKLTKIQATKLSELSKEFKEEL
jgi:hypothetical protein